jgi:hypothetical protein
LFSIIGLFFKPRKRAVIGLIITVILLCVFIYKIYNH